METTRRAAAPRDLAVEDPTGSRTRLPVGRDARDDDTGPPADAELLGLVAAVRQMDRWAARAVRLAGQLDGAQAAREEGMTVDAALRLHTGATRSDLTMVLSAAQMLANMPATTVLFERGIFSWGHIRALATAARSLDTTTRAAIDRHLGEHSDHLSRLDTDGRLAAIDDAITHHTHTSRLDDRTERDAQRRLLILAPRLDGSGTLFGDLDVEGFATVAGRLDAEADTPLAPPPPGDQPHGMARDLRDTIPTTRARQLADALVRICGQSDGGAHRPSPVRFTVVVDAQQITDTIAGTIQTTLASRPPRLVRRAIERLSCDAAYDVVIRRGTDLVAAHRHRPELTAATRRAVAARDGGCRFPGCRAPVTWTDIHHVTPRAAGGDHALNNLVLLCRRHHTTVHRRGWNQTLDDDGTYHLTRRGRAWTTLSRHREALPPPASETPDPGTQHSSCGHDPPDRSPPDHRPHPPDSTSRQAATPDPMTIPF